MGPFFMLRGFFRANLWRYLLGVLWLIIVGLMQLLIPRLLGTITDAINTRSIEASGLLRYVGYILAAASLIVISRFLWRVLINGTARKLEYYLRNKLFAHLQTLDARYYTEHKTGDIMAHATNDINSVRMAMGPGIIMITDSLFLTIATITMMVRTIDWQLTLLALLPLPFMAGMVLFFGRIVHRRFRAVQEAFSGMTNRVQESLSGIRVIQSFVQERAEIQRFSQSADEYVQKNMRLIKIWGLFFPLVQFISALSYLIVLAYGGTMVIDGRISLGDFVAFNSYLALLIWPMMALGWVINILQRGAASMERLNKILLSRPDVYDHSDTVDKDGIEGRVEFRGLNFAYPDGTVALEDIDIRLEQGQTLAIIGKTGSGKTTLVNLLLRIFNPPPGQLLVDGVDINKIPLAVLRQNIGYVPQETFLFSATLSENIALASDDYSQEEIEAAAKKANVYDNIIEFPEKFQTMSGERGVTLSGGQKQRISIARALIKQPSILILDDCLSAVDTQTEEKILRELKTVMKDRTSIIISHRVSTVQDADEIIVLDNGRIVERGKHEELLQSNGLYQQFYFKQQLEEKIGEQNA